MNFTRKWAVAALIVAILATMLPACIQSDEKVDGYTAVLPPAWRPGTVQNVQVSLFNGTLPANGDVRLALLKDGRQLAEASQRIDGAGIVRIAVPDIPEGKYQLSVSGPGFRDQADIAVENSYLVFLETDKPIYKPGQTIHIRVISLDPDLKPVVDRVTIEALDAKGIKVYRSIQDTDSYGMGTLDLPLSTEPNMGVWKLIATTSRSKAQLDVRVEEYVLPKYEVRPELPRDWYLVDERIEGKVTAEYTFGKPVKGKLKIEASRYVGQWQTYSTVNIPIDGEAEFAIPAAGYVAGVPASGGKGNVRLEITVEEQSTGYTEKTDRLLTVAQSSTVLQAIPSGSVFKPGLPFSMLLLSQKPDNSPIDTTVDVQISYFSRDFAETASEKKTITTIRGKALIEISPPGDAIAMTVTASSKESSISFSLGAGYSPSGNFIHLEQTSPGVAGIGDQVTFKISSNTEASNFYYEVISRGIVSFSDFTRDREISFAATPSMAPASRLLVYQVLPNSEVAADYLPFKVSAAYPHEMSVGFSGGQAKPGDTVSIDVATDGQAKVGIAAVDKSVYILAENRLNLQQVFDELERLYMKPQAELHEIISFLQTIDTRGAAQAFKDAGVIVISNKSIPGGKQYENETLKRRGDWFGGIAVQEAAGGKAPPAAAPGPGAGQGLADVERVRQFFPETWLWQELVTDATGKASIEVVVPDSISTWMLRAVGISKDRGLGVAEAQLMAFQPFFVTADLPYSAIRGEEFPLSLAIYNYLDTAQSVQVEIEDADWFDLMDEPAKTIEIEANDIGSARFNIRPVDIGTKSIKVTARSTEAADAIIKTLIVEPEGIAREIVDNLTLAAGTDLELDTSLPTGIVQGSGRTYLTLTSNYLTQTIDGLEGLLQMPFGCGEQNMIVFAPDVFITRYLRDSGQLKPEIMARAEKLMITGYQRELTYRHSDGSFSAFGSQDKEGSIWLTAFVLKSFSQASDLIYIDEGVLQDAREWIVSHQEPEGSFDQVGMVIHQEMMGGVEGKTGLTAYISIALMQGGEDAAGLRAAEYLETRLDDIDEPYTMALVALALEMAKSKKAGDAYDRLMDMAVEDENGLHWGDEVLPLQSGSPGPGLAIARPEPGRDGPVNIENTAYAMMALLEHGDNVNAGRAAGWLVSKRNAFGGFGSTQDTVVGLEALTRYSATARSDVDLTVSIEAGATSDEFRITEENFDLLQVIALPDDAAVTLRIAGKGQAVGQLVRRFSVPGSDETPGGILKIEVEYDVTHVEVDDIVKVGVDVSFEPPEPMEAGMTVVDISVPTGFAPVRESVAAVMDADDRLKRFDIAGRKVIFYIENMVAGDNLSFTFEVKALYPVSAKGVTSRAYSYYNPAVSGETLGKDVTVADRPDR